MRRLAASLVACVLAVAACSDEPARDTEGAPQQKPTVTVPSGPPPATLQSVDLVPGQGREVKTGDTVGMRYVGVSYSTGKEFDSNWGKGDLFEFTLGQGRVIKGWDQGIVGMRAGGRRQLTIPPDLAYGAQGVTDPRSGAVVIKPNETLIFVVDLVAIR